MMVVSEAETCCPVTFSYKDLSCERWSECHFASLCEFTTGCIR